MKTIQKASIILCLLGANITVSHAQRKAYWQQQVDYTIEVALNDQTNELNAQESFDYHNHSGDTLTFLYIHLWPNAYSNDRTAFSRQLLQDGDVKFYFSNEEKKGNITIADLQVNGENAQIIPDSNNVDIARLWLPTPIPPHRSAKISFSFVEKIPYNFSRGGHVANTYQLTQWYPKPAVYDADGWHPMPYLEDGEYYSEFGNYDVTVSVPEGYTVAASGKEISQHGNTVQYQLHKAHDFAWFASKDFIVQHDTIQLPSKNVQVSVYYEKDLEKDWGNAMSYVKQGVHYYSRRIGDYPYDEVKIVSGPISQSNGGMEYPTVALIPANQKGKDLETSIVHEVGHNWFYGALANNERDHAWMDEGMNSFYENSYTRDTHGGVSKPENILSRKLPQGETGLENLISRTLHGVKRDQPIDLPAAQYSQLNYGLSVYYKGAEWMQHLKAQLGQATFDSAMHSYYRQWQFRHPQPLDFKNSMEESSGKNISPLYEKLYTTALLDSTSHRKLKPTFLFNLSETDKYNYISLLPAVGYNKYDGTMLGGMVHTYQLPQNRFNFLAAPLYATASKRFTGVGRLEYNTWKPNYFWQASVSGVTYTRDAWLHFINRDWYARMIRIVPSLHFGYWGDDFRSTRRWDFVLRAILLQEQSFIAQNTGTLDNPVYEMTIPNTKTNLLQFQATVSDSRALYPYSANITIDQGKDFLRAGLTGKYFFNYSGSAHNGIQARLFAGKFFYLATQTFAKESELSRYNLSLSAPTGAYDFTYSDYFVGRNEYSGWMSQQTMERDGFMKVRTPYRSEVIGLSDNWIAALNLTGDIPKTPLKIFVDFGTYDALWQDLPPAGRFLYDAGVELSLAHSLVNIYVPLLYNSVFRNDYKNVPNYFWKTLSFNINLSVLDKWRRKTLWQ